MGRNLALETLAIGTHSALSHSRVTDDQRRLLGLGISLGESRANLIDVVAVDLDNVPIPRTILSRNILGINLINLGRELYVVGIVVHNQVSKAQVTSNTTYTLRDLLLHGTVRDERVCLVRHPLAKTSNHKALSDSSTYGHSVALTQRA